MGVRRQTVEHPFGTLKAWMGAGLVTATIDEPRGGKVKSGFMLRRHLATAPPLQLERPSASIGR
jgi:hypothetical protein